jgi:FtsZ-binding cell division protein ZapB
MSDLTQLIQSQQKENLNTTQKKYFQLIEEIEEIKKEKDLEELFLNQLLNKYTNFLKPLIEENCHACKNMAITIDKMVDQFKLPNRTFNQCGRLINFLLSTYHKEFAPDGITKRISETWSHLEDSNAAYEKEVEEINFRKSVKKQFNIDLDPAFDFSDPNAIDNFFEQYREEINEANRIKQESQKSKKKTKKELVREENEKLEKRTTREIYIGLAKILHPDRATNDEDRLAKEEAMKQATDAYERNDVIALLQLEIKYFKYDAQDLLKLSKDKINHLINSLKSQKNNLKSEVDQIKLKPLFRPIAVYATAPSKSSRLKLFDDDFAAIKQNNKAFQLIMNDLQTIYHKNDFKHIMDHIFPMFEGQLA